MVIEMLPESVAEFRQRLLICLTLYVLESQRGLHRLTPQRVEKRTGLEKRAAFFRQRLPFFRDAFFVREFFVGEQFVRRFLAPPE